MFVQGKVGRLIASGKWDEIGPLYCKQGKAKDKSLILEALGGSASEDAFGALRYIFVNGAKDAGDGIYQALERIGWEPKGEGDLDFAYLMWKRDWARCAELFIGNPGVFMIGAFDSCPLSVQTRRKLLLGMPIGRTDSWKNAFEGLYYSYFTLVRSTEQYSLYPLVILAWAKTGDGRCGRNLMHVWSLTGNTYEAEIRESLAGLDDACFDTLFSALLYDDTEAFAVRAFKVVGKRAMGFLEEKRKKANAGSELDAVLERILKGFDD